MGIEGGGAGLAASAGCQAQQMQIRGQQEIGCGCSRARETTQLRCGWGDAVRKKEHRAAENAASLESSLALTHLSQPNVWRQGAFRQLDVQTHVGVRARVVQHKRQANEVLLVEVKEGVAPVLAQHDELLNLRQWGWGEEG